ncbi:hypothetical protein, partial [Brasilonema bromeliae]|uniref:hypothetical protein n=1 Tax=Brasilonema bromeliae TaxID=383615 RepID=UPI001B7D19D4
LVTRKQPRGRVFLVLALPKGFRDLRSHCGASLSSVVRVASVQEIACGVRLPFRTQESEWLRSASGS